MKAPLSTNNYPLPVAIYIGWHYDSLDCHKPVSTKVHVHVKSPHVHARLRTCNTCTSELYVVVAC